MNKIKIVADSSADLLALPDVDFAVAPLKINTSDRDFIDDPSLDVAEMVTFMEQYKGKSHTSCPNTADWLTAFGDAEEVICVTITSALSGSCNAARAAARIYKDEHEGRRVFVLDSLSAGPEMRLVIEHLRESILAGMEFEAVCADIQAYLQKTGLYFMLKSLRNFANNGRISPVVAKLVGFAGICVVGRASNEGTLEPTDKCCGEARSLAKLVERMQEEGLSRGRVSIGHCQNPTGAEALRALLHEQLPEVTVTVAELRGLCSYYAETGGVLVGYEKM